MAKKRGFILGSSFLVNLCQSNCAIKWSPESQMLSRRQECNNIPGIRNNINQKDCPFIKHIYRICHTKISSYLVPVPNNEYFIVGSESHWCLTQSSSGRHKSILHSSSCDVSPFWSEKVKVSYLKTLLSYQCLKLT